MFLFPSLFNDTRNSIICTSRLCNIIFIRNCSVINLFSSKSCFAFPNSSIYQLIHGIGFWKLGTKYSIMFYPTLVWADFPNINICSKCVDWLWVVLKPNNPPWKQATKGGHQPAGRMLVSCEEVCLFWSIGVVSKHFTITFFIHFLSCCLDKLRLPTLCHHQLSENTKKKNKALTFMQLVKSSHLTDWVFINLISCAGSTKGMWWGSYNKHAQLSWQDECLRTDSRQQSYISHWQHETITH